MIWNFIAQIALNLVISYLLKPDTPGPDLPEPAKLGELDVPTAEEGRPFGVLAGRRQIKKPNTLWYGDLRTVPIKTSSGKK